MAVGRIEIQHIFPDETGYVVWTLRKTSNLLTLVPATWYNGVATVLGATKFAYPAPHPQKPLLLTDIDPVMYLLTPYRSSDGVALDVELNVQLAVDASSGSVYVLSKYEYVVDRGYTNTAPVNTGTEVWADPVSNQITLRDERLLNAAYWVVERSTSLLLDSEWVDRSDLGGGFDFTTPDKVFETGATYFVIVQNRQSVSSGSGSSSSSDFNDIVLITGDVTFDASAMGSKTLVSAYAGSNKVVTLTMPSLLTLPDCKFRIQTHGGTQRYIAMQLFAGDMVSFIGFSDWNVLYFGKGETVEVLIKSNIMYITNYDGDYKRVGLEFGVKGLGINGVYADGTQYNQADVPRLMQWINKYGIATVTEAVWALSTSVDYVFGEAGNVIEQKSVFLNKGLYAVTNTGTPTVRVPDLRNLGRRYMKYTDATDDTERLIDKPGGLQIDSFLKHGHAINTSNGSPSGNNTADPVRATIAGSVATTRGVAQASSGGGGTKTILITGGAETRMTNAGELPQIII